jgi:hypothetical protein
MAGAEELCGDLRRRKAEPTYRPYLKKVSKSYKTPRRYPLPS